MHASILSRYFNQDAYLILIKKAERLDLGLPRLKEKYLTDWVLICG